MLKTKESLAKALNNKTESDCKIRDLMAENELLKTNIRDSLLVHRATEKALQRDNCTLTEKLKSIEAVKDEVIEEKLDSDKRVKSLIEENKSLRNKMVEMKKVHKSQVDNLEIENKLWSEKVQGMEEEINYFQERSTNSRKDNDVTESSPELGKVSNKKNKMVGLIHPGWLAGVSRGPKSNQKKLFKEWSNSSRKLKT